MTNLSPTPGDATGAYQCVDGLIGGGFFRIAAEVLIPGGHTETGNAHLLVQWFDTAGCTGGQLGFVTSTEVSTATPDVWSTVSDMVVSPTGTLSARLRLSVRKNVDFGDLEAHFDNVEFEPWIFVDGFESGDSSAWSSTVP